MVIHRDIVKYLLIILAVNRLISAAQPARDPWRARRERGETQRPLSDWDAASDGAGAVTRQRVTSRNSHRDPAGSGVTAQTQRAPPGAPRGRRRGGRGRSRRRGRRAGRIWSGGENSSGALLIGHINIQSLKHKVIDLRHELDIHRFDLLSINETWLRKSTHNLMKIPGYSLKRADRSVAPLGYGGVAVLYRDSLTAKVADKPASICTSRLESIWIEVKIANNKTVLICSFYRPPSKTAAEFDSDMSELENQVQSALSRYSGLAVFVGDLNCNMNDSNPRSDKLLQLLSRYNLHQCISRGSVTYRPASSLLDVMITNRLDRVVRTSTLRCNFSPHNFIRALFRVKKEKPKRSVVMCRATARVDWDALRLDLALTDWSRVTAAASVEIKARHFTELLLTIINTHAPMKKVVIRNQTAPPLTAPTLELLARRREAERNGGETIYKLLNRQCRAAIRRDCRDNIAQRLREDGRSATWKITRSLLSGKRDVERPVPLVAVDDLNGYFATIGTRTSAAVVSNRAVPVLLPRILTCSFKVSTVSYDELRRTVRTLRNTGTCGIDGLPTIFVKRTFTVIGHVILNVVNNSLHTGHVPDSWKKALVYPIHKGGALNDPSQFRPISVVPLLAKITERIVQTQLYSYFSTNDLFSPTQHAYRRNHSTETALLTVSDYILSAMNRGEVVLLTMIDLSKCFDTVDHATLLHILELYGIDTEWFRSYLSGHTQQVQIRSSDGKISSSKPANIPIGIYQGTALGPLLFSIFSNDLCLHVPDTVKIVQYADDTQLMVSGRKTELPSLIRTLEAALESVNDWFASRKMKVNAKKTQLIVFGTAQMLRGVPPVEIRFGGETITETHQVRNLGVEMDRHMTFQPHVDLLTRRCTGVLIGLGAARHWLPRDVVTMLVECFVFSQLRYCVSVFGNASCQTRDRLQKMINFGARVVTGRGRSEHISDAVRSLHWLSAAALYQYSTITRFRAVLHTGEPLSLSENIIVSSDIHNHNTRRSGQFRQPAVRTQLGKRTFAFSAPGLYNALPQSMREVGGDFKATLKEYLLDNT